MQEILLGPVEDFYGQIAKIMDEVKVFQGNRYDYMVLYVDDRWPAGLVYMTPYQIRQYLHYGDLLSLDWQLKRENMYGWVFCRP